MTDSKNNIINSNPIHLNCRVYIVILNYNGTLDTIECLESLQKLNYSNYQIITVDNSETDLPFEELLNWASQKQIKFEKANESEMNSIEFQNDFVFVKSQKNNGFAAGNNIALHYILKFGEPDSYIWILNNDTVVDKDSLQNQISYLSKPENSRVGILGSKLIYYFEQSKIQAVGGKFNKNFYISSHVGEGTVITKSKSEFQEIDYVIGASMLVPHQFLREVGLLNEDFFLFYEELDWAYRAKKKNWIIDWCSDSIVFHKEGASIGSSYNSNLKSFFSEINVFKSRKIFVEKQYKLGLRFYISSLLLIANRFRKRKFKLALALLKITFER